MKSTPLPHFLCSDLFSFRLCSLSCLHLKVYLQYCIYISLFLNYRVPESGSLTQTCLQPAEFLHFDEENLLTPLKVLPFALHGFYLGSLFFWFFKFTLDRCDLLAETVAAVLTPGQWGLDLSQSLRIGTPCTSAHVRSEPSPAWLWGLQWKIVHLMPGDRHIHQRREAPACPLSSAYSLFRSEMQKQLTYWIVVEERWRVLLLLL